MSGGLFGRGVTSNANKNLIEFRAGKMSIQGNMVKPDKRKGLVYVYQSEDTLNHFCWKDRTTNTVEDVCLCNFSENIIKLFIIFVCILFSNFKLGSNTISR
jgi:hypothetical protein